MCVHQMQRTPLKWQGTSQRNPKRGRQVVFFRLVFEKFDGATPVEECGEVSGAAGKVGRIASSLLGGGMRRIGPRHSHPDGGTSTHLSCDRFSLYLWLGRNARTPHDTSNETQVGTSMMATTRGCQSA